MNDFMTNILKSWTSGIKSTSPGGELNEIDWAKIIRNLFMVSGSAALAAGASYLGQETMNWNFGSATVILVPILHLALDTMTKKFKNNQS